MEQESLQMLRCIHFTGVLDNDRSFSGIWIHECNPSLWRQRGHILSSTDSFIALHFHIFRYRKDRKKAIINHYKHSKSSGVTMTFIIILPFILFFFELWLFDKLEWIDCKLW